MLGQKHRIILSTKEMIGNVEAQNHICALLKHTLQSDPNIRIQAETELNKIASQPGFLSTLLSISCAQSTDASFDSATRQSAAIMFKNHVVRSWNSSSAHDKNFVRQHIVNSLAICSSTCRKQISCSLSTILANEENCEWPGLFEDILTRLSSADRAVLSSGLFALFEFVNVLRWKSIAERKAPISRIMDMAFPRLTSIAGFILNQPGIEKEADVAMMLKTIFKTFYSIIFLDLPKELQEPVMIGEWLTIFIKVFDIPSVPCDGCGVDDDSELSQHPWWKARKWALYNINRINSRYGNSKLETFREKGYKKFSTFFANHCAEKILLFMMGLLQKISSRVPHSRKVIHCVSEFICDSISAKKTWAIIKPNVPSIFEHFIFPYMCISEEDEEMMADEPVEYLQKGNDIFANFKTPETAASEFLLELFKSRQKYVMPIVLSFISGVLSQPPNYRAKEGALAVLETLSEQLMEKESLVKGQISQILIAFVVPELVSQHLCLRVRAAKVLRQFFLKDEEEEIHLELLTGPSGNAGWSVVFGQLMPLVQEGQPLPVRVFAALAIEAIMERDYMVEVVRPHVASIMKVFLELTRAIDLDLLTSAMERLVEIFPEEVAPFSVQLCQELIQYFYRVMQDTNNGEDDAKYDKAFTLMGVMNTISTLIMSVPTPGKNNENASHCTPAHAQTLIALEEIVMPCIHYTLTNRCDDLYSDIFGVLESIMFQRKAVSQSAWSLLPILCDIIVENGVDYIEDIFPSLDNYISFGSDIIGGNAELKSLLVSIVRKLVCEDGVDSDYQTFGFKIVEALFLNASHGHANDFATQLLPMLLPLLKEQPPTAVYFLQLLEAFVAAIYYDPQVSLMSLQNDSFAFIINAFLDNTEKLCRVHDRKLGILFILRIFSTGFLLQDPYIQSIIPKLSKALIYHLKELPRAEELRKSLEDEEEEEEEDSDEDATDMTSTDKSGNHANDSDEDDTDFNENFDENDDIPEEDYLKYQTDDADDEWFNQLHEEANVESKMDDIDVYPAFVQTIEGLRSSMSPVYTALTGCLSKEEQEQAEIVMKIGMERLSGRK